MTGHRILFILSGSQFGYADRVAGLARSLCESHEVLCVTFGGNGNPRGLKSLLGTGISRKYGRMGPLRVLCYPGLPMGFSSKRKIRDCVSEIIREWSIDTVVSGIFTDLSDVGLESSYRVWDYVKSGTRPPAETPLPDLVLYPSCEMGEEIREWYEGKTLHVPTGVNDRLRKAAHTRLMREARQNEERLIGLHVREERKVWDFLMEKILRRYVESREGRGVLVFGAPRALDRLQRIHRNDPRFRVMEASSPLQTSLFYQTADIGVVPLEEDEWHHHFIPTDALEYGLSGRAVVSGPFRELKRQNFPHVVFADPDEESWFSALDEAFEKTFREKWLSRFEPYRWDTISQTFLKTLEEEVWRE